MLVVTGHLGVVESVTRSYDPGGASSIVLAAPANGLQNRCSGSDAAGTNQDRPLWLVGGEDPSGVQEERDHGQEGVPSPRPRSS